MHTPAPQYADVTTAFIIQHVNAAAGADAAGDAAASSAGLSARRMSAGGRRTVTCAPTCASQYSCEK